MQRVPPTETKGRLQTSIVNVLVLEKPTSSNVSIDKTKLKFSYYKDSGKGGQHRNKTMSGVRIQYEDFLIECCETRDQRKNKEIALERLLYKIKDIKEHEQAILIYNNQNIQNINKGKRGNYNRNYNFPRNEVSQDGNIFDLKDIMRGNLDKLYCKL